MVNRFRPIQPVAGIDLLVATADVNLDAVAVVLDFMEPLVAFPWLGFERGKLRFVPDTRVVDRSPLAPGADRAQSHF